MNLIQGYMFERTLANKSVRANGNKNSSIGIVKAQQSI